MNNVTETGMLTHSKISRGVNLPLSELLDWQRRADGWTIQLASTLSQERLGADNWLEFYFWKGFLHNGEPPTVADLIQSIASDCNYLESEPESVSYQIGKAIEHNESKMCQLFGHQLWERIKGYSDEEIEETFGPFS